ncbi:MAG: hypothetical protein ACJA1M_000434 [Alphaproteobacteria bacterium]|jgi:hypothetical protein
MSINEKDVNINLLYNQSNYVIPVFLRSKNKRESDIEIRFPFPHCIRTGMTGVGFCIDHIPQESSLRVLPWQAKQSRNTIDSKKVKAGLLCLTTSSLAVTGL